MQNDPQKTFTDSIATQALIGYHLGCPVYLSNLISEGETTSTSLVPEEVPRLFRTLQTLPENKIPGTANVAKLQTVQVIEQRVCRKLDEVTTASLHSLTIRPSILSSSPPVVANWSKDTKPPNYSWIVYPIGRYNRPISTDTGYPIDLIFSIKITDAKDFPNESITEIRLQVPIGKRTDANCQPMARLMEKFDGPDPVILRNLRWNVIMCQHKAAGVLDITLFPRSTKNIVHVTRAGDCSFILPLVRVNEYKAITYVPIYHWESYKWLAKQSNNFLVKLRPTP